MAKHLAKITYEHSDGHQTVWTFNPTDILDPSELTQRCWNEAWEAMLQEIRLDAQRLIDAATNA